MSMCLFWTTVDDFRIQFLTISISISIFRCKIPECESNSIEYNPNWLINAIPVENGIPNKCNRFKYSHYNESDNLSTFCPAHYFNQSVIERCNEFIYKTDEKTILSEVITITNQWFWTMPSHKFFLFLLLSSI